VSHTVIIGAGFAGVAAAVRLLQAGHQVTLIEAGRHAGGRARRVDHRDLALDNGLHIMLGAYRQTLALMRDVGVPDSAFLRAPLTLILDGALDFRAAALPAPFNLAWGFLRAKGLSIADRIAAARLMSAVRSIAASGHNDETVGALMQRTAQTPKLIKRLWEPLCVAALNTPLASASARIFARVLADALLASASDSDLIIPRHDLSALLPGTACDWLAKQGATVHLGTRVTTIQPLGQRFCVHAGELAIDAGFVVLATGAPQAAALLREHATLASTCAEIDALAFESIHSVYIQFDAPVALPFPTLGLVDATGQWLFDRGALAGQTGLIGVVVSASSPLRQEAGEALTQRIVDEVLAVLRRHPGLAQNATATPVWQKLIVEKNATFAAVARGARPTPTTAWPGLLLAGDYVAGPYPATLEGAVRSGEAAAKALAGL
jgi:hydroxysqualene dehydroxylase